MQFQHPEIYLNFFWKKKKKKGTRHTTRRIKLEPPYCVSIQCLFFSLLLDVKKRGKTQRWKRVEMSVTDKSGSFLILFLLNFGWRLLVAPHFPFLFKTCSLTQIHVYTGCCSFNHLQPCLHFSGVHLGTRPESPPWSPQTVFLLFYTNVLNFYL